MSGSSYVILAYIAGLGLFWGYAAAIWRTARSLDRGTRTATGVTARPNQANRGDHGQQGQQFDRP